MLDIQFKQIDDSRYDLIVNGIIDQKLYGDTRYYHVKNDEVIPELMNSNFSKLKKYFDVIIFQDNYDNDITIMNYRIDLKTGRTKSTKYPSIRFEFHVNWELWDKPWSMTDFAKELDHYIFELQDNKIEYYREEDNISNGFGVLFHIGEPDNLVEVEFNKCRRAFEKIIFEVQSRLITKLNKGSHTELFNFPKETKVACEQYLIYFTQFLSDIGIEADSELENESGKVLFTVTPTDKNEGLDRIREALNLYLQFPEYKGFELYPSNEIAIQQLQANVMHLRSQLMLVNTTMQLKDATIESLQLSNYQYKTFLESRTNNKEETNILNDMITIKPYEINGASINLPKILKYLKRNR